MKTMPVLVWFFVLLIAAPLCRGEPAVRVERAFPRLHFQNALFLTFPPDGSDRVVVVEQAGRVSWFDNRNDAAERHTMVDLTGYIAFGGEEGLLGLAFHPDFKNNHQVFLSFTLHNPKRNVVARFRVDPVTLTIDKASQEILLEVTQPFGNHNGGMIAFGPDGMLYIGHGDGGAGGDPYNNGQNKNSLLGKILRIDVDHADPGLRYAIPKDNPFAGRPGMRGEVWAYGLRNPWRFSFDRATGDLWAGDVGQDLWEEVDLIIKGGNYGWNLREGRHDFRPISPMPTNLIEPIVEHRHGQGNCVTGGYVYRGKKVPSLQGKYIYGDYVTGAIWTIPATVTGRANASGQPVVPELIGRLPSIASFGEDRDGEVYVVLLNGAIFRFREPVRGEKVLKPES